MKTASKHTAWFFKPIFFLLLPLFFVLHGLKENAGFVSFSDAAPLLMLYLVVALLLYGLCWLLFRNHIKAALGSFTLMALHFFFGGLHDWLKSALDNSFITRYSFLLPILLLAVVFIFVRIKRTSSPLRRITSYLNILLLMLIAWDAIILLVPAKKSMHDKAALKFPACDSCTKPDIFLIVLDEYAGQRSLAELFNFNNNDFINELYKRGFYVAPNSRSNYNYTPFSMASMLNISYLDLKDTDRDKPDLTYAFRMINENSVQRMLEANGYAFHNHSVFNLPGRPAPVEETFIPAKTRLFTSQTLLSRLYRDLGYHLITTLKIKWFIQNNAYHELRNNTRLYDLTKQLAATASPQPRFVYTHLMMPHYPYYFDKDGQAMDPNRVLPEANNTNRQDYIQYLQYTNKKMLELADHILKVSSKPPVIIIMSDHGFRHFRQPVAKEYHFMNLNAVYLPNRRYQAFYDSVSNVNQFRIIFNTLFNTEYPLLKDSSVYLRD
ncbi:MAG TPA: sulfatase-like hydrolase/transferase [Chitinophagaceae bacterium]|nr:sulfatase-like hydrolase/transferase [Chitinophagaceae bacterium]